MATKVDTASSQQIKKTASLTSLFQARLAETPKKTTPEENTLKERPASDKNPDSNENSESRD